MKKYLLILPCLLLCFMLVAVPVSAAEVDSFSISISGGGCEAPSYDAGVYHLNVFVGDVIVASVDDFNLLHTCETYVINFATPVDGVDSISFDSQGDENGCWLTVCNPFEDRIVVLEFSPQQVVSSGTGSPLSSIVGIFSDIGSWIADNIGNAVSLFWNAESQSLTLIGVLSVCGLSVSIVFLLIGIVSRFLKFGG